jgi:hypothetical protein
MVKNAKAQADEYKGLIAKELDKVIVQVNHQRMKVKTFQDIYSGLVHKYLTELEYSDIEALNSRLDEVEKLVNKLKEVDIVPATGGDLIPPTKPVSSDTSPFKMPSPPPSMGSSVPTPPSMGSSIPMTPPIPPITMTPPQSSQQSLAPQISLGPSDDQVKMPPPPLPLSQLPPLPPIPSVQTPPLPPPTTTAKFNDDGTYIPG